MIYGESYYSFQIIQSYMRQAQQAGRRLYFSVLARKQTFPANTGDDKHLLFSHNHAEPM